MIDLITFIIAALDALVSVLMIIIVLCVFFQHTRGHGRVLVSSLFAFALITHTLYFQYVSDDIDLYYFSAAGVSMAVVFAISATKKASRLAGDLQDIAFVSILFNGLGWILHFAAIPSTGYTALYVALYGWAVFTLVRKEPSNDERIEIDTRMLNIRSYAYLRSLFNNKKQVHK